MRYMMEENFVVVFGRGWYNQQMFYRYNLKLLDIFGIGELNRENVGRWLNSNAGDFQSIEDFYATIGDQELDWEDEENREKYNEILDGS